MKSISSSDRSLSIRRRVRSVLTLLGSSTLLAGLLTNAAPASAQVIAPSGCGFWSGQPVPPGYTVLDLVQIVGCGAGAPGAPYVVPVGNYFVIGTDCDDYIQGNDVDEIFCGRDGDDEVAGGGGDDQLFGGKGEDILEGGEGADKLAGNEDNDFMWGEDQAGTIAIPGVDDIKGGNGNDFGDGGPGYDDCRVETAVSC